MFIQHGSGSGGSEVRVRAVQVQEQEGILIGWEGVKLSLFVDGVILYIENHKEHTHKHAHTHTHPY